MRIYLWVHLLCLKDYLQWLPLKLYVKWILWRDNMIDKLRRKITNG